MKDFMNNSGTVFSKRNWILAILVIFSFFFCVFPMKGETEKSEHRVGFIRPSIDLFKLDEDMIFGIRDDFEDKILEFIKEHFQFQSSWCLTGDRDIIDWYHIESPPVTLGPKVEPLVHKKLKEICNKNNLSAIVFGHFYEDEKLFLKFRYFLPRIPAIITFYKNDFDLKNISKVNLTNSISPVIVALNRALFSDNKYSIQDHKKKIPGFISDTTDSDDHISISGLDGPTKSKKTKPEKVIYKKSITMYDVCNVFSKEIPKISVLIIPLKGVGNRENLIHRKTIGHSLKLSLEYFSSFCQRERGFGLAVHQHRGPGQVTDEISDFIGLFESNNTTNFLKDELFELESTSFLNSIDIVIVLKMVVLEGEKSIRLCFFNINDGTIMQVVIRGNPIMELLRNTVRSRVEQLALEILRNRGQIE